MLEMLEHESKALPPIEVTLFGMAMLVRLVQDAKAPSPIKVTLFGIVMLLRFPLLRKE